MIFLWALFILVCLLLMLSVLLQSGRGEGLSGTFGGSSQFMGGRAAATFLTKATTTLAAIFMLMSILLSMLTRTGSSVTGQTEAQKKLMQNQPAQVAPTPATTPTPSAVPSTSPAPATRAGAAHSTPAPAGKK